MIKIDKGVDYVGAYNQTVKTARGDIVSLGVYFIGKQVEVNFESTEDSGLLIIPEDKAKEIYKAMKRHFEADLID